MTDHLSKHWPAHYRGKIPTRVRMTCHIGPDFWGILHAGTPRFWLMHGEEYPVKCNQHGALSVLTPYGELGIKPGEHEIIEWREPGEDVSGALPVGGACSAPQGAQTPNTTEEIRAILAASTQRAESATKGPLVPSKDFYGQVRIRANSVYGKQIAQMELDPSTGTAAANAEFFAAARTDLPARDRALMIAVEALTDMADGLDGPYSVDHAKHAQNCIDATEKKARAAVEAMLTALQGEQPTR